MTEPLAVEIEHFRRVGDTQVVEGIKMKLAHVALRVPVRVVMAPGGCGCPFCRDLTPT